MNATPQPAPAYTDAPTLHPNLLLGSLQLFGWLFFRPTAWCNHIIRIAPTLHPNFCLAVLTPTQWRDRRVQRLLVQCYVVWTILLGFAIAFVLYLVDGREQHMLLGITFGLFCSIVFNVAVGGASSVAGGLMGGVFGGIGVGVGMGMAGSVSRGIAGGIVVDNMLSGVTIGMGLGMIGNVMATLSSERITSKRKLSFFQQIGSIIIGIMISGITYSIMYGIAVDALYAVSNSVIHGIVYTSMYGVLFSIATYFQTTRWRVIIAVGITFGVLGGVIEGTMYHSQQPVFDGVIGGVLGGISGAIWISAFFVLATVLPVRVGGPWAGATATAFGINAVFIGDLMLNDVPVTLLDMLLSLGCILVGLTISWWRPIVFYPFLAAWNTLLYYADLRRSADWPSLLRWHSACWDELQRLPLVGLDDHLLLVFERNPVEGQTALEFFAQGHQRWAAQATQVELDARQLERCTSVEAIGQVHRNLAAGELAGPASALLRSFNRISQDVQAALQQASSYSQRLALNAVEDRLDGLLRELTRSSERYAARFRPIAIQWRQVIADKLRALAEAVEQRQEIESPYVIGVPLTTQQAIFVGRTDISARIESMLLDRRCPPLLLYGQRRMGKTSLLNNLGRMLPSTIIPLFVDLQGPVAQASDHVGLLATLARAMSAAAGQQRELALPPLSRQDLAADPFPHFDEWLDAVERTLEDRMALLMLDEFEALEAAFDDRRLDEAAVLGTLRHIIQHRPRFKVLLAGSHMLDEVERWASYLINVPVVRIGYLSEEDARRLTERPVEDFALRYTPEASRRVYTLTRGHPALVQLLCAEIVGLKNAQTPAQRRLATIDDVEAAAPEAQRRGSFFFADIERNQMDAGALAVLRRIAAQGEGTLMARSVLARQFPEVLDQALALLTRRELVEAVDGGYRVQVELIRRWFAQNGSDLPALTSD